MIADSGGRKMTWTDEIEWLIETGQMSIDELFEIGGE